LESIQKQLETGDVYAHRIYHVINTELASEFGFDEYKFKEMGPQTTHSLKTFRISYQSELKENVAKFASTLVNKWKATKENNLDNFVFGSNGFFNKCMVFDSHLKKSLPPHFSYNKGFFNLV
jgi:hypothetical protein